MFKIIRNYFCKKKSSATHPTYNDIHAACITISEQIKATNIKFDYVVGIMRGGMLPAIIISHALGDTSCVVIDYSSNKGKGNNKKHDNMFPEFPPQSKILLTDDICDTGNTLGEIFGHYTLKKHFVQTAVLHHKENEMHEPDYQWIKIPKDSPWIVYPFEQKDGNQ